MNIKLRNCYKPCKDNYLQNIGLKRDRLMIWSWRLVLDLRIDTDLTRARSLYKPVINSFLQYVTSNENNCKWIAAACDSVTRYVIAINKRSLWQGNVPVWLRKDPVYSKQLLATSTESIKEHDACRTLKNGCERRLWCMSVQRVRLKDRSPTDSRYSESNHNDQSHAAMHRLNLFIY